MTWNEEISKNSSHPLVTSWNKFRFVKFAKKKMFREIINHQKNVPRANKPIPSDEISKREGKLNDPCMFIYTSGTVIFQKKKKPSNPKRTNSFALFASFFKKIKKKKKDRRTQGGNAEQQQRLSLPAIQWL